VALLSINNYTGDGSTNQFSFTHPYYEKNDITVTIDGVADTTFTWVSNSIIQTSTTPANGAKVQIKRNTDTDALKAIFSNGSTPVALDFNTLGQQLFYLCQEVLDGLTNSLSLDSTLHWDALSKRIKNLSDGVANTDAATVNQVNGVVTAAIAGAVAAQAAAEAAQSLAETAQAAAETAQAGSETAQANAETAETNSETAATNSAASAAAASTSASNASTSASNAANSATNAANSEIAASYSHGYEMLPNAFFQSWMNGTSFASGASRIPIASCWTFARSSGVTGGTASQQVGENNNYCLRVQRDSGNSGTEALTVVLNLSPEESAPFIGKQVTLRVRARKGANFSEATGVLTCQLKQTDSATPLAITATNGLYSAGESNVIAQTATLTTSFADYSFTGTVSSASKQVSIRLTFTPVGTAGAADYVDVQYVTLDFGSAARNAVMPTIHQVNRAVNSRVFKTYNFDITPGSVSALGQLQQRARGTEATGSINIPVVLPDRMGGIPTITVYSPATGTSGKMRDETAGADINATAVNIGTQGFTIQNSAATTSGNLYSVHCLARYMW
jgi:hypothetical protein